MAFEDDMIEAGYSDEQEYLDSLIDDFEDNYRRQQDRELEYDDDFDSYYDEEEEWERREKRQKQEAEKQWVKDWKGKNPDLAIIWQAYFSKISDLERICNMDNRHFHGLNECKKLKEWLLKRERFESERKKEDWLANLQILFSMYKNELFKCYFPVAEEQINMAFVSLQARELQSIEFYEPSLWETVCSCYAVDPKLFEGIEEKAFWEEVYNCEMDYDYWKDNNIEKYNQFAKQWIAESASYWNFSFCVYGEWMKKHETEGIEWKQKNHDLWDIYKRNYEIRKTNEYIESKIREYKDKYENRRRIRYDRDSFEDFFDLCENKSKPFLPDLECTEVIPYDISSLDEELRKIIQDSLCSLDMSKMSIDSSNYADKVMTQLWIYTNRDEWEIDAVKKEHKDLFRHDNKYSQELLMWWKEKFPTQWSNFVKTVVPIFKNNFEIVMKFRLWALDGHKEEFFSIADKYLLYWRKTLQFIYGRDVYEQLSHNLYNTSSSIDYFFIGEDVDFIKICTYSKQDSEIEIWKRELRDKVIWKVLFDDGYKEHYFIDSMYTSLSNKI